MHSTFKMIGRIIALTLALPFLILALPVLLLRAGMRLATENTDTQNDETRLMQKIHSDMIRMDRRVESLETLLLSDALCPTEYFGRDGTPFEFMDGAVAKR